MSGAHTPGPWRDVGDGYVEAQSAPLKARSGWYDYAYLKASPEDQAEWQANARLIAAAPELLEALEMFLNSCGEEDRRAAFNFGHRVSAKARGDA